MTFDAWISFLLYSDFLTRITDHFSELQVEMFPWIMQVGRFFLGSHHHGSSAVFIPYCKMNS